MRISPENPEHTRRLAAIRKDIDRVDKALLELLNRRAACSLEVGKLKAETGAPVFRPSREGPHLEKLAEDNKGPLPETHLRAIFREILSSSRALQRPLKAAFLGPEGTFSHLAAMEFFGGSTNFTALPRFEDIFKAVENGDCGVGVIPLENSLHGTVPRSIDLFAAHDVHIQAEWFSRINHSVLSREASPGAVKTVYSHAQALGQCGEWLRANMPGARLISVESTAAAAHMALGETGSAAIGHQNLAARLGLAILAKNVEDTSDNWTRFVAIGTEPGEKTPEDETETARIKTSMLFTLPDKPGALSAVLRRFAKADVNMNKLESRPLQSERWKYIFFCDVSCDVTARRHAPLLHAIRGLCHSFRILGAYPVGRYMKAGEGAR